MIDYSQYSDDDSQKYVPEGKTFRIYLDQSTGKFRLLCDGRILEGIKNSFSDDNPASFFVRQYGYNVENKVSPVNQFGFFPQGFIWEILKYIKTYYGSLSVVSMSENCKRFITERLTPLRKWSTMFNEENFIACNISEDSGMNARRESQGKDPYVLRDYQEEAIKKLIFYGYGRGMLDLSTSAGKSFIIANFIWTIHRRYNCDLKYLIYVPNAQLVRQMYSDLIDYGYDQRFVTMLTSGLKKHERYNPEAHVIIANRQYLYTNSEKLPRIDVLFHDEVHTSKDSKSESFSFVEKLDCDIKVGCTGTMPDKKIHLWNLLGIFGKVVYKQEITSLQDRGFITKLNIDVIKIRDRYVDSDRNILFNMNSNRKFNSDRPDEILFDQAYHDEIEYMNKHCTELYTPVLNILGGYKGNMLVLFDRIEFGKNIFEIAKSMNIRGSRFFYVDGGVDVTLREDLKKDFESSDNNILFAQSVTFSTGISIKNLTNVVFFCHGKSKAKTIQSIGRALRLHKDKDHAQLIDVSFMFKYSHRHFLERMEIYKNSYRKYKPDREISLEI